MVISSATTLKDICEEFRNSTEDLILVDENSVIAEPHLNLLTDYPRTASAALVATQKNGNTFVRQHRIASSSSESHKVSTGNRDFIGAMRLSQNQREPILNALTSACTSGAKGNALDLTLVALVRATVRVDAAEVWAAPCVRSSSEYERKLVKDQLAKINMNSVRLRMANRANDGFFSVFFLRKFSKILTWVAVRIGVTPNQITLISFAIGLYAAYQFALGDFWQILFGAILLQVSIIVDCVDGELARYKRKFSKLGAWLDAITDRVKEYLVFFGLAYGAYRDGRNLWLPAIAMMTIQTYRHLSDYNFAQLMRLRMEPEFAKSVDFMADSDGIIPLERPPKGRLRYWLGKIIQFPIGERWLVISVSAVIGGAAFTFTIMPILSFISIFVVFRGRYRRDQQFRNQVVDKTWLISQTDLLWKNRKIRLRRDWLIPSTLRAVEVLFLVLILSWKGLISGTTFLLIFAILFHHYDNLYRALQGERKPDWLNALGLFFGGRVLIIFIAVLAGWDLKPFTWYFGILFFVIASAQWVLAHRTNKVSR